MLKQIGFAKGEVDGLEHAMKGYRYRPKPDLGMSILSSGYQEGYASGYHKAYHHAKQVLVRQELREQKEQRDADSILQVGADSSGPSPFDQGWRHGFTAVASTKTSYTGPGDIAAYDRGYRLGARDRDFARAKALRDQMTRENDLSDLQDKSERSL